jgi:hypothetical protein
MFLSLECVVPERLSPPGLKITHGTFDPHIGETSADLISQSTLYTNRSRVY